MREREPFAREKRREHRSRASVRPLLVLPAAFLLALAIAAWRGALPREIPIAYAVLSVVSLIAYARDKSKAGCGDWRTPESTLHFLDLFGGWPGGLLAQQLWRHKTRKLSFQLIFWPLVALHLAFWGWVWVKVPARSGLPAFFQEVIQTARQQFS